MLLQMSHNAADSVKLAIPEGFKIDLLLNDTIIIELKSVEKIRDVHKKQLLTYLRLTKKPLGLLINFNEVLLKDGIIRIANTTQV
jgi:GxxExxY protein